MPKVNNLGGISKILNFHPIDLKFEKDIYFRSLNLTTNYFGSPQYRGQKVNIVRISKIVNFHPIHLKFKEDLQIWSLNSTTNYFWGQICFMDFASVVLCTMSSCLSVCLCTGYLKKLWTDSDETWWTGWMCRKDQLIRFWWRSESGSGYENYLICNVILHHWEIGPKTT